MKILTIVFTQELANGGIITRSAEVPVKTTQEAFDALFGIIEEDLEDDDLPGQDSKSPSN